MIFFKKKRWFKVSGKGEMLKHLDKEEMHLASRSKRKKMHLASRNAKGDAFCI